MFGGSVELFFPLVIDGLCELYNAKMNEVSMTIWIICKQTHTHTHHKHEQVKAPPSDCYMYLPFSALCPKGNYKVTRL